MKHEYVMARRMLVFVHPRMFVLHVCLGPLVALLAKGLESRGSAALRLPIWPYSAASAPAAMLLFQNKHVTKLCHESICRSHSQAQSHNCVPNRSVKKAMQSYYFARGRLNVYDVNLQHAFVCRRYFAYIRHAP